MRFHSSVHGANVSVEEGGSLARRVASFCDGLAFSARSVAPQSRTSVVLASCPDWSGALRLGLSAHDPAGLKSLPRYACPDLAEMPGFWARPLPESWARHGSRLTFYLTNSGQFQLFVNGEHKGALFTALPTKEPLWLLVDLYGTTVSAKFVPTCSSAPVEVVSRGPEALQAYRRLCTEGSVALHRGRVALIGPCAAGKTALRRALLRTGPEEDGTAPIELSAAVQTEGGEWRPVAGPATEPEAGALLLPEEEMHRAIAVNVVREVLAHRRRRQLEDKRRPPTLVRSALKLQSTLSKRKDGDSTSSAKSSQQQQDGPVPGGELPPAIAELVEAMLGEADSKADWDALESEKRAPDTPLRLHMWDHSGHPRLLPLHQLFLSPQAVYVLVFDLSRDLEEPVVPPDTFPGMEMEGQASTLQLIHAWLSAIHAAVGHGAEDGTALPPVLLVGTHRASVYRNLEVRETFSRIQQSLAGTPYGSHVVWRAGDVALELGDGTELREWSEDEDEPLPVPPPPMPEDDQVDVVRRLVTELALRQPHVGMEVPVRWLACERLLERLQNRGLEMVDLHQLAETARLEHVHDEDSLRSMLEFLHHEGRLWHSDTLEGLVVLQPSWLVQQLSRPFLELAVPSGAEASPLLLGPGVLSASQLDAMWAPQHRASLIALLEALDLACELEPTKDPDHFADESRCYLIPWLAQGHPDLSEEPPSPGSLVLVVDFGHTPPPGLVSRLLVRLCRWSEQHNWQKRPSLGKRGGGRVCIDQSHDLVLRRLSASRILVVVEASDDGFTMVDGELPSSHVCAKVKYLLETELEALKERWYKRIAFSLSVPCPCDRLCDLHEIPACPREECLHQLPLAECLARRVVECDYRRVKTDFVQKYFPEPAPDEVEFGMDSAAEDSGQRGQPLWTRGVAKLLGYGQTGKDWLALAKRLGYSEREVVRFGQELNPSLVLLRDWLHSHGHTRYCLDLLVSSLERMGRGDVAEAVRSEGPLELGPPAPVFLSYQWDAQESVLQLRRRLELAGFPCWMDIGGGIGGGDSLYGRIYEGVSRAKVFVCCLTPSYALSPTCAREASLADVLRVPVLPVMLEPTSWPPPGPLAVLLSPLVYVDLCGVGGHGGSGGRQADWEAKFSEIIERLAHFVSPVFPQRVSPPSCRRRVPMTAPRSGSQRKADGSLSSDLLLLGDSPPLLQDDLPPPQEATPPIPSPPQDASVHSENEGSSDDSTSQQDVPPPPRRHVNRVVRCHICNLL